MTRTTPTHQQEIRHDTDIHLQAWHGIQPPYLDTPETVHTWLHNDQAEQRDRDHNVSDLKAGGRS